jgi:hypothetical protein
VALRYRPAREKQLGDLPKFRKRLNTNPPPNPTASANGVVRTCDSFPLSSPILSLSLSVCVCLNYFSQSSAGTGSTAAPTRPAASLSPSQPPVARPPLLPTPPTLPPTTSPALPHPLLSQHLTKLLPTAAVQVLRPFDSSPLHLVISSASSTAAYRSLLTPLRRASAHRLPDSRSRSASRPSVRRRGKT